MNENVKPLSRGAGLRAAASALEERLLASLTDPLHVREIVLRRVEVSKAEDHIVDCFESKRTDGLRGRWCKLVKERVCGRSECDRKANAVASAATVESRQRGGGCNHVLFHACGRWPPPSGASSRRGVPATYENPYGSRLRPRECFS